MLPVDWITLLYFSQGLAEATRRGLSGLSGVAIPFDLPGDGCVAAPTRVAAFTRRLKAVPGAALMLASLGVLLLGASVPLLESSFPNRYPAARQEAMRAQALASPQLDPESCQALEAALANGAVAFVGRGLYPRYLPPNVGEEKDPSSPLSPRPYPRMVFYLIGDVNQNVMLPLAKKPKHFPNAADVVVIACPPRDLWATFVFSSTGEVKTVLLREPFPTQITCPLPAEP
jgi:hypothetical protein